MVLNTGCPQLEADLRRAGFVPHSTELGEFIKAGGSAEVPDPPARRRGRGRVGLE